MQLSDISFIAGMATSGTTELESLVFEVPVICFFLNRMNKHAVQNQQQQQGKEQDQEQPEPQKGEQQHELQIETPEQQLQEVREQEKQ